MLFFLTHVGGKKQENILLITFKKKCKFSILVNTHRINGYLKMSISQIHTRSPKFKQNHLSKPTTQDIQTHHTAPVQPESTNPPLLSKEINERQDGKAIVWKCDNMTNNRYVLQNPDKATSPTVSSTLIQTPLKTRFLWLLLGTSEKLFPVIHVRMTWKVGRKMTSSHAF